MVLTLALTLLAVALPWWGAADDDSPEWSVQAQLAARSLMLDVAVVDGRLVAVGERGHILTSDDAGASWRQARVPTRATLTGVYFHDRELGWAVGHDGVILRTGDGGTTWERVRWEPEDESPLLDVWFSSPLEGFAIGAYGTFLVTANGGTTWRFEPIGEDDFHLNRIARAADGLLYMAAEAGMIYRSDDGGDSWEELLSPYEGSFFGVLPLEGDSLLVYGLRGHLFRSDDAGESWTALETDTTAILTDGLVLQDGTVVVIGLAGAVLVSADGGRSFQLRAQADRRGVASAVEGAPGELVTVGEGGIRSLAESELISGPAATEGSEDR